MTTTELSRLEAQLNASEEAERVRAAKALGTLATPEALAVLAARLEVPDRLTVIAAIMDALAAAGPTARPTLERLHEHAESDDARRRLKQVLETVDSTGTAGGTATDHIGPDQSAVTSPVRKRSPDMLRPVPWGLREALLGEVVAQFPEVVPALLTLLAGITAASSGPTNARALAAVVGTAVFDGWWIAWAWVFSLRKFHLDLSAWGFRRPRLSILWLVPLAVVASTVVEAIWGGFVHVPRSSLERQFPHTALGITLVVVGACILAPLFEEVFFRGFLFQGFASWRGALWGAVISSALWSAGHAELALFVPFFVIGLLQCWVFRRGGSIWTNVAVHVDDQRARRRHLGALNQIVSTGVTEALRTSSVVCGDRTLEARRNDACQAHGLPVKRKEACAGLEQEPLSSSSSAVAAQAITQGGPGTSRLGRRRAGHRPRLLVCRCAFGPPQARWLATARPAHRRRRGRRSCALSSPSAGRDASSGNNGNGAS